MKRKTKKSFDVKSVRKFRSIRKLMEAVLKHDKYTSYEEAERVVRKFKPDSKFNRLHFAWYRHHIIPS